MKKKTTESYNEELKNKGFNLECKEYKGALISTVHICDNNHIWTTSPSRVLVSSGCPKCRGAQTSVRWSQEEEDFLRENYYNKGTLYCKKALNKSTASISNKVKRLGLKGQNHRTKTHDQYELELLNAESDSYPLESYINAHTPILHSCIENHEWKAAPSDVLNKGHGCPICSKSGFNPGKPAILYYIKLTHLGKNYYKIGITNRSIESRFSREDKSKFVSVLLEEHHSIGQDALNKEMEIKNNFKEFVTLEKVLTSGNSEIFTWDILQLDV